MKKLYGDLKTSRDRLEKEMNFGQALFIGIAFVVIGYPILYFVMYIL
jgi:hypothetical protein